MFGNADGSPHRQLQVLFANTSDWFEQWIDGLENFIDHPEAVFETDAEALEAFDALIEKYWDRLHSYDIAKLIAKSWRRTKTHPREDIQEFVKFAKGNRNGGYGYSGPGSFEKLKEDVPDVAKIQWVKDITKK